MKKTKNLIYYCPIYLIGLLALFLCACNGNNAKKSNLLEEDNKNLPSSILLEEANNKIDNNELDEALVLLDSTLSLPIESIRNKAEIYAAIGYCQVRNENYHEALQNYLNSIMLFKELNDKTRIAQMELNSATCFKIIGIYDRAAKNAISAKQVMSNDSLHLRELALINSLLGNIHKNIASYSDATNYYYESMNLRKKIPGLSLASPINNLGNNYYTQKKYDSALLFFSKYKAIATRDNNLKQLGRAHYNLGKTYLIMRNLVLAKTNINLADSIFEKEGVKLDMCALMNLKSQYYLNSNISIAESEAKMAYDLSKNLGVLEEEKASLKSLSDVYIEKGDFKEALKYSNLQNEIIDKLDIKTNSNKIYSYEMLSQMDVKNAEIELI